MISMRTVVVSLLSLAFSVFSFSASADNKIFAIAPPASVDAGTGKTVTVTFSNLADGNSTFNSITLIANASIGTMIITSARTDSAKVGTVKGLGTSSVTITDLSPTKPTRPLTVTLTVTTDGCSADRVVWDARAWTGSPGTPSNYFTLQTSTVNRTTSVTAPDPGCSMSIKPPTSAAAGVPFDIQVNLINGSGNADITLASVGCTYTGAGTKAANGYSATFTGLVADAGTCTFTASATNGYGSATPVTGFRVFSGAIDCGPLDPAAPVPTDAKFDASTACGATGISISNPGFAAGFRGPNKNPGTCNKINASLTNNICGAIGSTKTDANGNTVPPKAVSFVWDTGLSDRAAFTYTLTWAPEYVSPATGLPRAQATQRCTGPAPDPCGSTSTSTNKVPLKACTSTNVAFSSIPLGDPACIAEEGWVVVPQTQCAALSLPAGASATAPPACIVMSTTVIDALDPVMIRD